MTKWQRFGDGTWVNVDHVEVIRVDEEEDGGWQLTAAFSSGRTHLLGRHDDREMLVDCTDVLLRGEVGEHLRALTDTADEVEALQPAEPVPGPQPAAARRRRWWFRRPEAASPASAMDGRADAVQPQPVG